MQAAKSSDSDAEILSSNPYESSQDLTPTEAQVLWEYAKLNVHLKQLLAQTRRLAEAPNDSLIQQLRVLESKMGFVFTLYKASVWSVINSVPDGDDSHENNESTDEASFDTTMRA